MDNQPPKAHPGSNSHHVRKVIRVGHSAAITIPPHVLEHLGVEEGDFLIWDLSCRHYGLISRVHPPPYITDPDIFTSDGTPPPKDSPSEHATPPITT